MLALKAGGDLRDTAEVDAAFGSPAEIGELFLSDHLLAFEMTSIVLLVGASAASFSASAMPTSDKERRTSLMLGPGIASYLVLSVVLFATGAFGVLIRRSPLIILLALEMMLNAGNLALIAFARQLGNARRADLRAGRDGRRRRRGGRRPRPHRRHVPQARRARRRPPRLACRAERMMTPPGSRCSRRPARWSRSRSAASGSTRRGAGLLAAGATFVSFVCSSRSSSTCSAESPEERARCLDALDVADRRRAAHRGLEI